MVFWCITTIRQLKAHMYAKHILSDVGLSISLKPWKLYTCRGIWKAQLQQIVLSFVIITYWSHWCVKRLNSLLHPLSLPLSLSVWSVSQRYHLHSLSRCLSYYSHPMWWVTIMHENNQFSHQSPLKWSLCNSLKKAHVLISFVLRIALWDLLVSNFKTSLTSANCRLICHDPQAWTPIILDLMKRTMSGIWPFFPFTWTGMAIDPQKL